MNKPFTFLCHGTLYHEESKVQSLIAPLSQSIADKNTLAIINGPAGQSSHDDTRHPMPGTHHFDPKTGNKIVKKTAINDKLARFVGTVAGFGVDDNLIEMLDTIIYQTPRPSTINLLGFSRGADTCLRFANLLYDFLPDIEVNIFAIEPVAGPGRGFDKGSTTIPPNVNHYVSTLALHEAKLGFEPQDFSRLTVENPEKTTVEILPFPGNHGNHASLSGKSAKKHPIGEAVSDIAVRTLKSWGTEFSSTPSYTIKPAPNDPEGTSTEKPCQNPASDNQLLAKFAQMIQTTRAGGFGSFAKSRFFVRHAIDYSPILPQYFVNTYHMTLFAKNFPFTFSYLKDPTGEKKFAAAEELQQIKETQPEIWYWLLDTPKIKKPVYFNAEHDSLTGHYQKMMIGLHHYQVDNKAKSSKERADVRTLTRETRRIMTSHVQPQVKERLIQDLARQYRYQNPGSKLGKALQNSFTPKGKSPTNIAIHHLKAAQNVNIFERIIHSIKAFISPEYKNYYQEVNTTLDHAIEQISSNAADIDSILQSAYRRIDNAHIQISKTGHPFLHGNNHSMNALISLERLQTMNHQSHEGPSAHRSMS